MPTGPHAAGRLPHPAPICCRSRPLPDKSLAGHQKSSVESGMHWKTSDDQETGLLGVGKMLPGHKPLHVDSVMYGASVRPYAALSSRN